MTTDYHLFDNAILSHVRAGKVHFHQINGSRLREFADRLAGKDKRGDLEGWRLIDRRLQALRKVNELRRAGA